MYPCEKCLNNRWNYEYIDGWVRAICEICGNEVEFEAKKESKYEIRIGDECKKCNTITIFKKSKFKPKKLKKLYYYTGYIFCPKCRTVYYSDKYKIVN